MVGTLQYMAPEILNNDNNISFSYDIWTLGCFLYEIVAGEPPFGKFSESTEELKNEHLMNEVKMKDYFSKDF